MIKLKRQKSAPVVGAQWNEFQLVKQGFASSGHMLGCGTGPQWGACKWQPYIDVSLPLSASLGFSLKINKIFKKERKITLLFFYLFIMLEAEELLDNIHCQYLKKKMFVVN